LVGVDGLARVVDFGIAKAEGRVYQTSRTGVKGKLSYVAPEYLSKGQLDRRSDVYSAAVVLWEMIAGRRLFTGYSEHQVMARVLGLVVPPLAAERPETPPALAQIVARALSRDPDERFPDAQAMARALRGALPLAGNDEVGAWVRSLAAESLAARADALRKAQQAIAARGLTAPTSEEPASHRRPVLSLIDLTAPPADGLSSAAPRARVVRRALGVAATVVASACAVGLSWAYLWPEAPPARPAATWVLAAPLASAMPAEASLQALAASSVPRPPQATDAEPARRSVSEPSAELAARPPPASDARRVRVALPVREKRKPPATTPTSCDPPYTYDREGIRHFKPQCL
ncbi:MAG TPA: protein kinase, partial [Polyangiaceae bacterium]|nr:protein kinase [Polyangiaceae bacterium]